jgi:HPt (histidine-containing phosphotransfer) domain-containing protein
MEDIDVTIDPDLADLVPRYLSRRADDLVNGRYSLSQGEFTSLERMGHNFKGSAASFGFHQLSEIGVRLERAAHCADSESTARCLDELCEYLARLRVHYHKPKR